MPRGNRRATKVEREFFKHQLQKREDQAYEESDDEQNGYCKIRAWAAKVHPKDGEGDPPKPKRTLSFPPPPVFNFIAGAAHAALHPSNKRMRKNTL